MTSSSQVVGVNAEGEVLSRELGWKRSAFCWSPWSTIHIHVERSGVRYVRYWMIILGLTGQDFATPSETSKVENALAEMPRDLDQQIEKRADDGKANMVTDALSRKERVKPRRAPLVGSEMDEAHASSNSIGPEIVQETTDKVVSINEKFKAVRDHQKSYAGNRHKPLEFEVGDHVLLKVSPWKGVIFFEKKGKLAPRMDDPNITMEEYIRLEEEKAQKCRKVFNWETTKYGKILYNEDIHDLRSVETEFPAIAFNDGVSSEKTLSCELTVSSLNDEIDFRISFDDSDDEDYTVIFDKNSFSYKIISTNDLKMDSENDNEKVMPSLLSPKPTVSYFDDLAFFKDFENEFPAIVYNDA
ncbi:hypothetical protein Tco_0740964 [Tanacetum coccineum]